MAVKKVIRRRKPQGKGKQVGKRAGAKATSAPTPSFPGLPTERKEVETELLRYTGLIYAREKFGKTTYLASFPEMLFLTTEPGTKGLSIYEYNAEDGGCRNWALVRAAVDLLEKTKEFKCVCFDTVDRAYDMCLDWVCKTRNIEYPGTDEYGQQDYGKSWKAVKQEFLSIVHRILQTGRGLYFTSHAREQEIKTRSGDKYTRIYPTMSNQARAVVEALVDFFFYGEYMRAPDGSTKRVLITEGDEVVWAGAREIGQPLPRFIPMTARGGYDILQAAFDGEDVGLDPETLLPRRSATPAIKKFFAQARVSKPAAKPRKKISRRKA